MKHGSCIMDHKSNLFWNSCIHVYMSVYTRPSTILAGQDKIRNKTIPPPNQQWTRFTTKIRIFYFPSLKWGRAFHPSLRSDPSRIRAFFPLTAARAKNPLLLRRFLFALQFTRGREDSRYTPGCLLLGLTTHEWMSRSFTVTVFRVKKYVVQVQGISSISSTLLYILHIWCWFSEKYFGCNPHNFVLTQSLLSVKFLRSCKRTSSWSIHSVACFSRVDHFYTQSVHHFRSWDHL